MPALCSLLASSALLLPGTPDVKAELHAFADLCGAIGWSGTLYVEKNGKVLLERSLGFADIAEERALEPDDAMEAASITKLITAVAVVRLHQDDKLDLDEPIRTYLKGVGEAHADVTVRHLLSHSSGMERGAATGWGDDRSKAVVGYLQDAPTTPPGQAMKYWNGGYALLAAIVEEVTGSEFEDYVAAEVYRPAGMQSATFVGRVLKPGQQAMGYELSARSRWAATHPYPSGGAWSYKGMGGAVCTARDLAKFATAFAKGKLVKKSLVREMTTPVVDSQGLGWKLIEENGEVRWMHGGDVAGFHSVLEYMPEEKLVVAVMSNRSGSPQYTFALALRDLACGKGQLGWFPKMIPWKAKDWRSLEGEWVLEGQEETTIRVDVADCVRMTPLTKGARSALGLPPVKATSAGEASAPSDAPLEPEDFLRLVPLASDELTSRPLSPTAKPHRVQVEQRGKKAIGLTIKRYQAETLVLHRGS